MNHVYRLIWREAAGGFVAVAEMACACGARTSRKAVAASCALLAATAVQAAGAGFNVVDGSASLATSGATSTVTQTTNGVRIEWQSLGVAAGETLKFVQPSASSVALNVIKGVSATEILGQLQANGHVFILNPNGVLVGAGAQVSVGGFMASTNDLSSFNAATGATVLQANGSTAEVRNAGSIIATQGGMVALVGNKVINTGTIVAPGGGIYLLGGGRVEFKPGDGSPFTYSLTTDSTNAKSVVNSGSLTAAGGQIAMDARSTKQAVVNAGGVIEAGRAQTGPDGSIRLTALGGAGDITAQGALNAGKTGTVKAELDAGGTFTRIVGDPNGGGPLSPANTQWLSAQDKTYDGTTAATVALDLNQLGAVNYFVFKLTDASFDSRHADTDIDVSVAGKITQSYGANFQLPASLTATITPRTVGTTVTTKTYDGTTTADVSYNVDDILAADRDHVKVLLSNGEFEDIHAGDDKGVTYNWNVKGEYGLGQDYVLTGLSIGTITPKVIGTTVVTKTYDGTTTAQVVANAGDILARDKESLTVKISEANYEDRNAGEGKGVSYLWKLLSNNGGAVSGDYKLAGTTSGNIDKAQLTLSAVSDTKVFDNTTASTGAPVVGGLVSTDSVTGLSQSFSSAAVGDRTLNVNGGYVLNDGNDGKNYSVTLVSAAGRINEVTTPTEPTNPQTPDNPNLGTVINNGGSQPTQINVDLAGLGDLLAQLPPTAAGEEDDPKKIKARRRSDRSPLRVTEGGVKAPSTLR